VHNFGPAIPQAAQAGIFDAYRREATAGNHRSSIGLGLFIASEIVRAHGGAISVRSPDRDGTTFSVVLPRRPVGVDLGLPSGARPRPPGPRCGGVVARCGVVLARRLGR